MKRLAASAFCFFTLLLGNAEAQGDRSLTSSEWMAQPAHPETRPAVPFPSFDQPSVRPKKAQQDTPPLGIQIPLPRTAPDAPDLAKARMQETILLLRSTIAELTQSLALANAEAETFRRQGEELALRLDSLGLIEMDGSQESLEHKLLTAVREVRLQQNRNMELETALIGIAESVIALLQETPGIPPQLRLDIETQMRKINELLGTLPDIEEAPPVAATLTSALIIDSKPELSLVIINIGSKQGVRIGTPFRILRGNQIIGTALAVDVRERISGAIIQNLTQENQPARTGDRLSVITN